MGNAPRPPHWGGFRVCPDQIDFWTEKPFRLHERTRHQLRADGSWEECPLYP